MRAIRIRVQISPAERGTGFRVELSGDTAGLALALRPWLRLRAEIELHRAVRGFRSWIEDRARAQRAEERSRSSHLVHGSHAPRLADLAAQA